ncbi:GlcG/HbpS family heme-binding protein [Streptomyces bugieae]|uniref:Heme-binding protein n=1 Tax=Streptomyces bugieae TaxID=3098223 RepID=A0ABU7P217_9ACTN|nr:heme-binding protein [Streptomyces sp. DSM 41528]
MNPRTPFRSHKVSDEVSPKGSHRDSSKASRKVSAVGAVAAAGAVATALVGAGVLGGASATAAPSSTPAAASSSANVGKGLTRTTTHLTLDAATKAAQAALKAAEKAGQRISVAVVDRNGSTLVALRGDGAGPQAYESAARKAFTAVSWNAPTSDLVKRLDEAPTLKDIPGTLFLAGGAPVRDEDAPIAGIGVAGAPSGALDEQFAQAGVHALDG